MFRSTYGHHQGSALPRLGYFKHCWQRADLSTSMWLCFSLFVVLVLPTVACSVLDSTCLHVCMSPSLHVSMSACLHIYMSPCLHVSISACLHLYMSPCLHVCMSPSNTVYLLCSRSSSNLIPSSQRELLFFMWEWYPYIYLCTSPTRLYGVLPCDCYPAVPTYIPPVSWATNYPVTVLVNIVFRLMKEGSSVKLQTPKVNIWTAANESSRHLIWKFCTSPVRRGAVEFQHFLWLAGRHVGPACRPTAIFTAVLLSGDWRLVEYDAVKSGKYLLAFRRIAVLLCRVKQLSLDCFTLKVMAERCFETSVLQSNIPDDFDPQLLPVRR
jgi:hypothetical protein